MRQAGQPLPPAHKRARTSGSTGGGTRFPPSPHVVRGGAALPPGIGAGLSPVCSGPSAARSPNRLPLRSAQVRWRSWQHDPGVGERRLPGAMRGAARRDAGGCPARQPAGASKQQAPGSLPVCSGPGRASSVRAPGLQWAGASNTRGAREVSPGAPAARGRRGGESGWGPRGCRGRVRPPRGPRGPWGFGSRPQQHAARPPATPAAARAVAFVLGVWVVLWDRFSKEWNV